MASALSDLSVTSLSNGTKLGQQMAENATPPSAVNNAVRGWQAYLAMWMKDNDGSVASGGTATAVTATLNQGFTAYGTGDGQIKNGERIAIKMGSAATGAATLNLNALGAKAIRREGDAAIAANDWLANATVLLRYDTAYNAAAGAWVLLNADAASGAFLPLTGGTLTGALNVTVAATGTISTLASTDAGAAAGPDLDIYRNSASPAANDVLGSLLLTGNRGSGAKHTYFSITPTIVTTAPGGSVAKVTVAVANDFTAGSPTNFLYFGGNAAGTATADVIGLPLGRLSFPATQNASSDANTLDDYKEAITTPTPTSDGGAFTSASSALTNSKIGNRVFIDGVITITTVGGGSGAVIITLPYTPNANGVLVVRNASTGISGTAQVSSGSGTAFMRPYDGTSFIAAGASLNISGHYRTA